MALIYIYGLTFSLKRTDLGDGRFVKWTEDGIDGTLEIRYKQNNI